MRISLDIMEATVLLSAIRTEETALNLRSKKARKVNDLKEASDAAMSFMDLQTVKQKLEDVLASETKTGA